MRAYARAEWDPLKKVALHKPGLEVFFGLLEPEKSLFKRRFDFVKARKEYEELIDALKSEGVATFRVLRSIIRRALKDEKFYEKLKRNNVTKLTTIAITPSMKLIRYTFLVLATFINIPITNIPVIRAVTTANIRPSIPM